jgi:hypothetical protein
MTHSWAPNVGDGTCNDPGRKLEENLERTNPGDCGGRVLVENLPAIVRLVHPVPPTQAPESAFSPLCLCCADIKGGYDSVLGKWKSKLTRKH